jgi:sodium transport system permease protein
MRWFIIRTIWLREMRDQLRDRRTLFMILGLPLVLYPLLGYAVVKVAVEFTEKPSIIGVVTGSANVKDFPPREPTPPARNVAPALAWLSATPLAGSEIAACALAQANHLHPNYPLLIDAGRWTPKSARESTSDTLLKLVFLEKIDPSLLDDRKFDVILEAPDAFFTKLEGGEDDASPRPVVQVHVRPGDDRSRQALHRMTPFLAGWKSDLKKVRLARKGLTEQFLDPFEIRIPEETVGDATKENVISLIVRFFPLMLVMWSLSGALYPAIDLCAGEKERGTMETLLITPAGREEIVVGKFLTIWVFSSGTALLNLLSMGITTSLFSGYMPQGGISIAALFWCVVLSLPQAAFFSALGLAIGAYARSSKEGQYYLMPLFVVTMPLICLTLVPGIELNPFYAMVPVTGVALLMQKLMTAANLSDIPWAYFVPVLAPIGLYSWLALRWAIEQFNREEVLFREAERLDLMLWLKRLFREKEPVPTTGQAFFCLVVLIGLRWLTLGLGDGWQLEMRTAISQLAFVAMPPLFMVILLNTQPAAGLYLRWPRRQDTGLAVLLALLLLPPMAGFAQAVALWIPQWYPESSLHLLEGAHPLLKILRSIQTGDDLSSTQFITYILAFALVPALCEEIAFRGFVLRGLHEGFRPRNAVLLSSFFFALFHLNVFLFVPTFLFGVVLGLLTVRSRSLLPAISFHLLHNSVLIALIPLSRYSEGLLLHDVWPWLIGLCVAAAAALVWWLYRKPYVDLARQERALLQEKDAGGK